MLIEIDKKDIGRYNIENIMVANDKFGSWVPLESMIGESHIHLMVDEETAVSRMPEVTTVLLSDADPILYYDGESKRLIGDPEEQDPEVDVAEDEEKTQIQDNDPSDPEQEQDSPGDNKKHGGGRKRTGEYDHR